jgi:hypothetical protein
LYRKVKAMPTRSEAEENLRVIRSLMERATIYRAISAPGALFGGLLSVLAALGGALLFNKTRPVDPHFFIIPWLLILAITAAANGLLLWRDAKRRGDTFLSPGMKLVLNAMLPGMVAGGLPLCLFIGDRAMPLLASLWVLFYGISLLAAAPFAPGSIRWLGRFFFVGGAALLLGGCLYGNFWEMGNPIPLAYLIMGATFGLFHLIYSFCTWPRKVRADGFDGQ